MKDEPHITYFNMGSWPIYVGFTTSPKAFAKEMKRLKCGDVAFLSTTHADATTHFLVKDGSSTCIITMRKAKDKSFEQRAGLIAHEAMHVVQELWSNIGEREPGKEAEAYLIQMITQCCLQEALNTGRVRKTEP